MEQPAPVTLEGKHVRLEPLGIQHLAGIVRAGQDESIWTWLSQRPSTREDFERWLNDALKAQAAGIRLPFATIERASGEVVGSTSFLAISPENRRLEIGWTWLAPSAQRTPINTEAKYLQLRHCFETLGCVRVELKTDVRNTNSRRAIERIGAKYEGVMRKDMLTRGGFHRDSVYFAIIDDEWPEAKRRLEEMLRREPGT